MNHKVEYLMPGLLVSESITLDLSERSVKEAVDLAPKNAFCFTFFDVPDAPDLGEEFTVTPKPQNRSGRYYLGGEVLTLKDVREHYGAYSILLSNMRGNEWDAVIKCRTGNFQPFTSEDVIVKPRV